jgi:hypothetical protein
MPSSVAAFGSPGGNAETVGGSSPTTPFFVLPYKRFATPCLIQRCKRFLRDANVEENSQLSYRQKTKVDYRESVKHNRQRIGYPTPKTAPQKTPSRDAQPPSLTPLQVPPCFDQPIVDHSLIWRMVTWLGSLTLVLDIACQMILQSNPDSLCHRYISNVNPDKARSLHRLATLETADRLLHVIDEWEATFDKKFFPRFATRSGFD